MEEDVAMVDIIEFYKEELSNAHERIVVLECRVRNRDREIERLKKDE